MERFAFERQEKCAAAPEIFQRLRDAVERHVQGFNEEAKHIERALIGPQKIGEKHFRVRRGYSPEFTLDVILEDGIHPYIEFTMKLPAKDVAGAYSPTVARFDFYWQETTGTVVLFHVGGPWTVDEAAERMLAPALEVMNRTI